MNEQSQPTNVPTEEELERVKYFLVFRPGVAPQVKTREQIVDGQAVDGSIYAIESSNLYMTYMTEPQITLHRVMTRTVRTRAIRPFPPQNYLLSTDKPKWNKTPSEQAEADHAAEQREAERRDFESTPEREADHWHFEGTAYMEG